MVVESACNVGCGGGVLFFIKTGSEERETERILYIKVSKHYISNEAMGQALAD